MDNKQKELNAKRVYTALCTALDELHLHYSKNTLESGSMVCDFKMESDDLPLSIRILVSPSAEILSIYSSLPAPDHGNEVELTHSLHARGGVSIVSDYVPEGNKFFNTQRITLIQHHGKSLSV